MADFNFKCWETMNVEDWYFPSSDVNFIILDHESEAPYEDANILYSGVKPSILTNFQNLENILAPKLELTTFPDGYYPVLFGENRKKTFYLYESATYDDWSYFETITIDVEYDWSYIENRAYTSDLSDPIEYKVDPRQYLTWTCRQTVPGTQENIEVDVNGVNVFWIAMTQETEQYTLHLLTGDYAGYTEGTEITINDRINLELTNMCNDYCIYYLNDMGGWDWLLLKEKTLKKDKLNRLSYKGQYTQQNLYPYKRRNKNTYTTIINENWEMSTGWLNDIQSSKMHNLLESNQVVLHNLSTGILTPVLVTNSNVDYKTYKNQGRKLYSYTIELESSNPKYRL